MTQIEYRKINTKRNSNPKAKKKYAMILSLADQKCNTIRGKKKKGIKTHVNKNQFK